ncbi:unnamed protein product [Caenorhabditis brenneri]
MSSKFGIIVAAVLTSMFVMCTVLVFHPDVFPHFVDFMEKSGYSFKKDADKAMNDFSIYFRHSDPSKLALVGGLIVLALGGTFYFIYSTFFYEEEDYEGYYLLPKKHFSLDNYFMKV